MNVAKEKAIHFAVRIVNLQKYLIREFKEYTLSNQILRSGTSIGANISEAESAISEKDFLSKIYIALKETSETLYWLELLHRTNYLTDKQYLSLFSECMEIKRILTATTKTLTRKLNVKSAEKNII